MKKVPAPLLSLALCLLTACELCGVSRVKANTTYNWTYTADGQTHTGTFQTNEYGQASFEVPSGVDCSGVKIEEKNSDIAMVESAV